MSVKFLGKIVDYNPETDVISIKLDFVSPEKQEAIEDIVKNEKSFTFWFTKPFRRMKTYPQLRRYFWCIKRILIALDIFPSAEKVKTMDNHFKRTICDCDYVEFTEEGEDGNIEIRKIPIVPSKADMTVEQLSYLIGEIQDRYESKVDWETGEKRELKGFD